MALEFETIPFTSHDGFQCNLLRVKSNQPCNKGPLLLVHGAGVRANIFNPPNEKTLIQMAHDAGYDVWLENWRGSIDLEPNPWDLDIVANNDHPAAVQKIVQITGEQELKAIIHCQGSTSFMISAAKGLVPQVKTIISNAVSLHPVVPKYSRFKLKVYVPLVTPLFKYINPQWGKHAPDLKSKFLRLIVKVFHQEDDTLVGKFVSFTYGAGWPALWRLENLNPETKNWIQDEFAEVPLSFFHHISKCVRAGQLVTNDQNQSSYPDQWKSDARVVLFAGAKNLCFLDESQKKTYDFLNQLTPGKHKLHVLDKYSHLDVFFGKDSHKDVFPIMLQELNEN